MLKSILFALVILFLTGLAGAAIYKWVDNDGKTHYGECPPPDCKAQEIKPYPGPGKEETERAQERLKSLQQQQKRSEAQRAETAITEQDNSEKQSTKEQVCLEARKQLAALQTQMPIYFDEDGNYRARWARDSYEGKRLYLDDAARTAEINRVQKIISTNCQNPDDEEEQESARKEWVRSEFCAAARASLEELERPGSRASRQSLEDKQQEVDRYCKELKDK